MPGVARIVFNGTLGGVATANVMHASKNSQVAWTGAELSALATAARTSYVTNFIPLQDGDFALGSVDVVDLTSDTGDAASATGTTPGTKAGLVLPASIAMCVSWRIGRRYRGGHPRTYFPALVTADQATPNTWNASTVTAWQNAAAAFLADLDSMPPGQLGMLSRINAGAPRPAPLFSPILGVTVDSRIDSQRRRLGPDR